ncbi:MAG: 4-hydroxythreonine-4-phosphate dehydrogenase PdxA [Hyphomonadaceae bacterium]
MKHKHACPLALTMGDPAGCGPQITGLAWQQLRNQAEHTFAVIGPADAYAAYAPVQVINSLSEAADAFGKALPVVEVGMDITSHKAGAPDPQNAPAIIGSIERGAALAMSGEASGLVTNPINKALLYGHGFKFPGHTEFLAHLTSPSSASLDPVMMLVGGGLRVALATIHMPLMQVGAMLTQELLSNIGQITHDALERDFGIDKPRLVFTGLNPHAGEDGSIGTEERDIINPAASALRGMGLNIGDARSADTVFAEMLDGNYDAIIAMTHDQGLIPVKTLDFWGGVNVTLGLPIIRTSPDHGTAYEAAANGTCRPDSLIAAIKLAAENAARRTS